MSLLYPLGLLALLAIPVLIIIYIIKSKYTEQVIASTYLWTLSERFLKRKNPIKRITGIISLILQILAVVFIALALAHPVFTLAGKANDYCFILDGSGSMNVVENGSTRFDAGKERVREVISSAAEGSTYTLVVTGDTVDTVLKGTDDKKFALRQLESVQPSYVSRSVSSATAVAQTLFDQTPSCIFYVITDKDISEIQNAEVIKVGGSVHNLAVDNVKYTPTAEGIKISGEAYSYAGDAEVNVDVFADGGSDAVATAKVSLQRAENADSAVGKFETEWKGEEGKIPDFSSLTVKIRESDALALDNSVILYNPRSDSSRKTLVVSDNPFFLEAFLASMGNMQREVIDTADYSDEKSGYGLYIFDSFTPSRMPSDGAVWFINPDTGADGSSGFTIRGREELATPTPLDLSKSTSTRIKKLLEGTLQNDDDLILSYVKCGIYRNNFSTLLSCNGDPIVFAGTNTHGNREVVFALDFNTSDFAVSHNGRVLMYNLMEYTFPSLIDGNSLYCGEAVTVNVPANCTGIRVDLPSGKSEYLDTSDTMSRYELSEVGEFTITATVGGNRQVVKVYSSLPVAERIQGATEVSFIISGEASTQKRDGIYEDLLYAFIILAVIVVADWMVYCYEQYQLR